MIIKIHLLVPFYSADCLLTKQKSNNKIYLLLRKGMSEIHNSIQHQNGEFNLNQAGSYTLLLQLEVNSFNYAIINNNRLVVVVQDTALNELKDPDQIINRLSNTYKKVIIGLPATGLTLVPKGLYNAGHAVDFARLLDVKENESAMVQELDDQNMIVYKTSNVLVKAIEKFDLKNVVYTAKGWIKAIANNNPTDNTLFMEIGHDTVQFLYFSSGKLRFYNSFDFKNADELTYFTALVAEELDLDAAQTTLALSGFVINGDENLSRLTEFFMKVELNDLQLTEPSDQFKAHNVVALAALLLCE
jgi:hypothetical protein